LTVKNMTDGTQSTMKLEDLVSNLRK